MSNNEHCICRNYDGNGKSWRGESCPVHNPPDPNQNIEQQDYIKLMAFGDYNIPGPKIPQTGEDYDPTNITLEPAVSQAIDDLIAQQVQAARISELENIEIRHEIHPAQCSIITDIVHSRLKELTTTVAKDPVHIHIFDNDGLCTDCGHPSPTRSEDKE